MISIGYSVRMRIVGAPTSPNTDKGHSLLRPPSKVEKTVDGGVYKVLSSGIKIHWNFHSGVWAASSDHICKNLPAIGQRGGFAAAPQRELSVAFILNLADMGQK